jgi:phospholipid/cholesterol/gamma-HCH transport system ATP-binding protein
MRAETPILELAMALADPQAGLARNVPLSLRLAPGECVLVEAAETVPLAILADLCSGLVELRSGQVRFLDRDWQGLPSEYAAALRGRIGRIFTAGAWVPFLDVESNILLPALHHTTRDQNDLQAEALALAHEFGLPGLPRDRPADLSRADLDRAALVRAFLDEPLLVLIEDRPDLSLSMYPAVLNRVVATCDKGGAVVWFARERTIRNAAFFPATQHFRMSDQGLIRVRH